MTIWNGTSRSGQTLQTEAHSRTIMLRRGPSNERTSVLERRHVHTDRRDAGTRGRVERGQKIADKKGHVKKRAHNWYDIQPQSDESTAHEVRFTAAGPSCECPDHQYRKTVCMHIVAVMQRNSDSARDKAGADVPDMRPMPDPGAKQTEHGPCLKSSDS